MEYIIVLVFLIAICVAVFCTQISPKSHPRKLAICKW